MSTTADPATPTPAPTEPSVWQKAMKQKRFVVGSIITLLVVLVAVFGPFFAPYGENEVVGPPFSSQGVSSAPTTWARTSCPG